MPWAYMQTGPNSTSINAFFSMSSPISNESKNPRSAALKFLL
jgi:hypothetical protein